MVQVNDNNKFNIYSVVSGQLIYSFELKENLLILVKYYLGIILLFFYFLIEVYKIKISNKNNKLDFFHKYKYEYKYYDEIIKNNSEQKNKNGYIISFSNNKLKNDFIIYNYHGIYQKIKFNTNNPNNIYCYFEKKFNL